MKCYLTKNFTVFNYLMLNIQICIEKMRDGRNNILKGKTLSECIIKLHAKVKEEQIYGRSIAWGTKHEEKFNS